MKAKIQNVYKERSAKWWVPTTVFITELTATLQWLVGAEEWLRNSSQENLVRLFTGIGNLTHDHLKIGIPVQVKSKAAAFRKGVNLLYVNRASKAIVLHVALARWLKTFDPPKSIAQVVHDYYALQAWAASKMNLWEVQIDRILSLYVPQSCYRTNENSHTRRMAQLISRESMKPVWSAIKFDPGPYMSFYGYHDFYPKAWKVMNDFDLTNLGVTTPNPATINIRSGHWKPDKHFEFNLELYRQLGKPLPQAFMAVLAAKIQAKEESEGNGSP